MKYMLSGIDQQSDKGFGINAEAYKKAADQLYNSEEYINTFNPQKHMPIFYLYRHSIELYFKSMIYIFQIELNLLNKNNLNKPNIQTKNGEKRSLHNCHWLDELFWYWAKLMIDHNENLKHLAPKADWRVHPDLDELIVEISKYDKDSTYFRYPFERKQNNKDTEKYSMKKTNNLNDLVGNEKGGVSLIITDKDENIRSAYVYDENLLNDLLNIFKKTSKILSGYHVMTRMTLCQGY